jgi:hypothetical protein
MKRIKEIIIAILIVAIPVTLILFVVYLEVSSTPKAVKNAYEPFRKFSIPMDTSLYQEWEDNFDTSYTDSYGIITYSHKNHAKTR